MSNIPRFKYKNIIISYIQIPYVDRVYSLKCKDTTLYFKNINFKNLINPKSNIFWTMERDLINRKYSDNKMKKLWKRWKKFQKKIKVRDKELDKFKG